MPHDLHPHRRLWGTFPSVLGHYFREVGLFPLGNSRRQYRLRPGQRHDGLEDDSSTGARPGRALRRQAMQRERAA